MIWSDVLPRSDGQTRSPAAASSDFVSGEKATARALSYRPEIDGLRAVAILAVVLYHADVAPFGGGFVGVDVFFVISGFLITSIIQKDVSGPGFSFARFYERRIRRIFPALFVMAAFCVFAGALILIPTEFGQFGRSLMAMAVFASNLFFRKDVGVVGYFHSVADPPLLIHTWSLAVEEQFYIVLPPALLLLHRYAGRRIVPALLAGIVLSFVASVVLVQTKPSDAFYLITSRAWELLIGSLLAVQTFPPLAGRVSRELVSGAGFLLIVFAVFRYTDATLFPGASALAPCLGTWLIIYAGNQGRSLVTTALTRRPMVFVGRISYSLYLWHWPMIVVTKYLSDGQLTLVTTIAAIALSLVAATLSYFFVEAPFRRPRRSSRRRPLFAGTAIATMVLVATGGAVVVSGGFPRRFDPATLEVIAANLEREKDAPGNTACENYRRVVTSVDDLITCPIGTGAKKNILFWGDSHVEELRPVIETLHREHALGGRGAVFAVAPACAPSLAMDRTGERLDCATLAKYSWERANADDIDTVFIFYDGWRTSHDGDLCQMKDGTCVGLSKEDALNIIASEFGTYASALHAKGKRLVIALPDPAYSFRLPHFEILKATLPRLNRLRPLERLDFAATRERLASVAREHGALVFDPRKSLCRDEQCLFVENGVSLYVDDNHIAKTRIGIFHDGLRAVLAADTASKP